MEGNEKQEGEAMEDSEYRVWQRVAGKPQMALDALLRKSQEQAAALRALWSVSSGQRRSTLQRLSAQAAFAAQTVAGAAILEGETPQRTAPVCPEAGARRALALAYRRSRELWEAYQSRSGGGSYGQAFQCLAEREAQAGTELLALLGTS